MKLSKEDVALKNALLNEQSHESLVKIDVRASDSHEFTSNTPQQTLELLTIGEHERLNMCEDVLRRGLCTFLEVGLALLTIREARLYRSGFKSFEIYCKERWGMGRNYAWRLIGAAERIQLLPPETRAVRPINEFQIRPFLKLKPEFFPKAWEQVIARAKNGKVTPALIRGLIAEISPPKKKLGFARKKRHKVKLPKSCSVGEILVLLGEARIEIEKGDTGKALRAIERVESLVPGS